MATASGYSASEAAVIAEGISWLQSTSGDSEVPDNEWTPLPTEWLLEAEVYFQQWLLDGQKSATLSASSDRAPGADSRYRRCAIGLDRSSGGKAPLPWTSGVRYSADFLLMTCMVQSEQDVRARVLPLRRLENGRQSHPDPSARHPWFLKRVQDRDSKDWFNNDFFFRAFTKAMTDAGHKVQSDANSMFDFRFNQDFRGKPAAEETIRGGVMYQEPVGWKKFATRVKGLFDGGNNSWLCLDGRQGEWAIAYHGTNFAAMPGILGGGLKVGDRQAYKDFKDARTGQKIGTGIYCTPSVKTASEYSPEVEFDGKRVQFVFQCRVRPEAIRRIHEEVGRESGAYWLINDPSDIRPYGVLAREV